MVGEYREMDRFVILGWLENAERRIDLLYSDGWRIQREGRTGMLKDGRIQREGWSVMFEWLENRERRIDVKRFKMDGFIPDEHYS